MDVVIDSNVLFRILISKGEILKLVFNNKLKIFAPQKLKEEFIRHKDEILSKSKLSKEKFDNFSLLIFKRINSVPLEEYEFLIPKAKQLLDEHTKDEEFVALSLSKNSKLWTYEDRLFKIGVGISTKEISDNLKSKKL